MDLRKRLGLNVSRIRQRRNLSQEELARLGETLVAAQNDGENLYAIAAIRLLMLTGCRKNEALTLQWDWIDFERQCLRLPDSKTGAKVVYLSPPALDVLARIERQEGSRVSPLRFNQRAVSAPCAP